MDYSTLGFAGMLCLTSIILTSMYLNNSRRAANQWRGRYLALTKQAQNQLKVMQGQVSDSQFEALFKQINMDGRQGKKLLKSLKKVGVPEELILTLLNNPELVTKAMGKIKGNIPISDKGEAI